MVLFCLIIQVGLLIFDGWLFMFRPNPLFYTIAGHSLASCLFALCFGGSLHSRFSRQKAALLGGLFAFNIPVAGMGCMLLTEILLIIKPLPSGDILSEFEKYTTLSENVAENTKPLPVSSKALQTAGIVGPFRDMYLASDSHQKQMVLDAIVKRKNPRFYPLILAALKDPLTEINQYAVAKVQKLRDDYEMKISKAEEAAKVLPTSIDAHYRLALAYCEYMESGLMDPSVAHFFQSQFQKEYRKILTFPHSPTEERIFSNLGQLSLQMKHWNEAESAYRKALELQPDSLEANVGFVKLFYERKMYTRTFKQIHRIQEVATSGAKITSRVRELTRCWLPTNVDMDEDDR